MPTPAQDRVRRGPLAALLILLSLFLGSANAAAAAAGTDLRAPASRLGSSRQGTAAALLPPANRNPLEDEASGAGTGPALVPSAPGTVTERLWARPRAEARSVETAAVLPPSRAPYRARAPPAS